MESLFHTTGKGERALDAYFEGNAALPIPFYSVLLAARDGIDFTGLLKAARSFEWMGERVSQPPGRAASTVLKLIDNGYIDEVGEVEFEEEEY